MILRLALWLNTDVFLDDEEMEFDAELTGDFRYQRYGSAGVLVIDNRVLSDLKKNVLRFLVVDSTPHPDGGFTALEFGVRDTIDGRDVAFR